MQRVFLFDLDMRSEVLFTVVKGMKHKTAFAHHFEGAELWGGARTLGHDGILVSHSVYDRAIQNACARMQHQRHEALRELQSRELGEKEAYWNWLRHWTTSAGCTAHDFSNALRWANLKEFSDRDTMKKMWVVVESLRNSLDQLISNLGPWMQQVVAVREYYGGVRLSTVWALLGVPPDMCTEFEVLQLRFEDGRLLICPAFANELDTPQRICNCMMSLFEFRSWSDTRWGAVGKCCRQLVACHLAGLQSLVAFIRSCPSESNYFIDGFKHMDSELLRVAMVCGISSRVSEVPLKLVLADDRLPRLLPELDAALALEMDRIENLDASMFDLLAEWLDVEGPSLADQCIHASVVQLSYSEMRVRAARALPWSLIGGDVRGKLEALKAGPVPVQSVAMKIHRLANLGVALEQLECVVELMSQLPFSTRAAEQGHSTSSVLMKLHKGYTSATMCSRAVIMSAKQLVHSRLPSHLAKLQKTHEQLARLRRREPSKIRGRQAF